MKTVRIGIIGLGGIAQGTHIPKLLKVKEAKITAVCDCDAEKLKAVGDRLEIPEERRFPDYRDLIACDEVDAVEICTPNYLHAKMAVEAVNHGKPFNLEKPVDIDLAAANTIAAALEKRPVTNMVCMSYRFRPAVRYARHLMDQGVLGEIVNVNIEYLKDSAFWPGRRLDWRFVKAYAGSGVLGDLGVHLIDLATFLIGEMDSIVGLKKTVVKQRRKLDSEELAPVETDDLCAFLAKYRCGASATCTITRCAIGHRNTIRFEIYGTKGILCVNLDQPDILRVCIGEMDVECGGMHEIRVPDSYGLDQEQNFVNALLGKPDRYHPALADGLYCQKILDALLLSSEENRWVSIDEMNP